jgi:RiboL-PSP-HEPN
MDSAKDIFLNRMSNYGNSLTSSELITRDLNNTQHNEKARMLRNGLAIIGYNILEDFIKKRLGEIFKEIGNSNVPFSELPEKLKDASVFTSLKSILERAENLKRGSEDYITFIQDETRYISSTKNNAYELSAFTLGWDKSNLNSTDISNYMKIFNIDGGWNAIKDISIRVNCSLLNPEEIFRNAARRRHRAAHNADAESLLPDLINFANDSRVIAFCFDVLLSKSITYIKSHNVDFLNSMLKTQQNHVKLRFLIEKDGFWKEYKLNFSKAYRVNRDYQLLYHQALNRARMNNEYLLVKSQTNQILQWISE